MNELENTADSVRQQGQDTVGKAADAANNGIRSVQSKADQTLDKAADKVDAVRNQTAPMLDKVIDQAQKLVQRGRESLHDATRLFEERAASASDQAVGYTKDEPVKAMLMATAAGALLMGLVTMIPLA